MKSKIFYVAFIGILAAIFFYFLEESHSEIRITDPEFILPNMTTSQRNALTPVGEGHIFWNTDTKQLETYSGSAWTPASGVANTVTSPSNFTAVNTVIFASDTARNVKSSPFTIPFTVCPNNQILKSNGTNYVCANDLQTTGAVAGPPTSTQGNLAQWGNATGNLIQDTNIPVTQVITSVNGFTAPNRPVLSGGFGRAVISTSYTIPTTVCPQNQVLKSDGVNFLCSTEAGGGDIVGPPLAGLGNIPRFNAINGKSLGDSGINSADLVTSPVNFTGLDTIIMSSGTTKAVKNSNFAIPADVCPSGNVLRSNGSNYVCDVIASSGDVTGPGASGTGNIAIFGGTTGKVIADSNVLATNLVTKTSNFSEANRIVLSAGNTKAISETGYRIPGAIGTSGQILISDGSNLSWTSLPPADVSGPVNSTNNALVRWDGAGGDLIQDSNAILDDAGKLTLMGELDITGLTIFNIGANSSSFPIDRGTPGQFLKTDGLGQLAWATAGDILGPASSVTNTIPIYNSGTGKSLGTSGILSTDLVTTPANFPAADHVILSLGTDKQIKTTDYTLPSTIGINGEILTSQGGSAIWSDPTLLGIVVGPATSTDFSIPRFDGATGKIIKDSLAILDDSGNLTGLKTIMVDSTDSFSRPIPRMTAAERMALIMSVTDKGAMVFDTSDNSIYFWDGEIWVKNTKFRNYVTGETYYNGDFILSEENNGILAHDDFTATGDILEDIWNYGDIVFSNQSFTTAVLKGGIISFNAPNFSISAGIGLIVKRNGKSISSTQNVKWDAVDLPLADPNGWNTIQIKPDSTAKKTTGTVEIVSGVPTPQLFSEVIPLGVVFGPSNNLVNLKGQADNPANSIRTLSYFLGSLIKGMEIIGNNDRSFITNSGELYFWGISPDSEIPNAGICSAQGVTNFNLYKQDGLISNGNTQVDTSNFDNGGTLTLIGGTKWSCMKVYFDISCKVSLQYCQNSWNTFNEAVVGEENERIDYIVPTALTQNNRFQHLIFFQNGASQFDDKNLVKVKPGGILGLGSAGSGSGGAVGDVLGPGSAIDNHIVTFDGLSGKVIKDSGIIANNLVTMFNLSVDNAIPRFDGTNRGIEETGLIIDDTDNLSIPGNLSITGQTIFNVGANSMSFPLTRGTDGQVLSTNGQGNLAWINDPGGDVMGPASATAGNVAIFNNPNGKSIGDSNIPASQINTSPSTFSKVNAVILSNTTGRTLKNAPYAFPTTSCLNGEILKSNGTDFSCQADLSGTGDVIGPASSLVDRLVSFSDSTGKIIKDSGVSSGNLVQATGNFGGANRVILAQGNNKILVSAGYTFPVTVCSNNQVLKSNGTNYACGQAGGAFNAITAAYTIASTDCGGIISVNSASAVTISMPNLSNGCKVEIVQQGLGQVTVNGSGGMTIQNPFGLNKTRAQYSMISIIQLTNLISALGGDVN